MAAAVALCTCETWLHVASDGAVATAQLLQAQRRARGPQVDAGGRVGTRVCQACVVCLFLISCGREFVRSHTCGFAHRYSSYTNRLIQAKDHASVQINVGNVDPDTGKYTGDFKTFALCGYIRDKGEGDLAITTLLELKEGSA